MKSLLLSVPVESSGSSLRVEPLRAAHLHGLQSEGLGDCLPRLQGLLLRSLVGMFITLLVITLSMAATTGLASWFGITFSPDLQGDVLALIGQVCRNPYSL